MWEQQRRLSLSFRLDTKVPLQKTSIDLSFFFLFLISFLCCADAQLLNQDERVQSAASVRARLALSSSLQTPISPSSTSLSPSRGSRGARVYFSCLQTRAEEHPGLSASARNSPTGLPRRLEDISLRIQEASGSEDEAARNRQDVNIETENGVL